MRGMCGWFSTHTGRGAEATLRRMLASNQAPPADATLKISPHSGLAIFGASARPRLLEEDGFLLAVAGHPRWCEGGLRTEDDGALLHSLREHGKGALARIGGDFALAAWNPRDRRGLLAVDRIGIHQLVYTTADRSLAFASTLDMLA